MSIYQKINELIQQGVPSAVATIVRTEGSTPRDVGTKMIIQYDGTTYGTIGGGPFELQVIKKAKEVIEKGTPIIFHYDLTKEESGMVCGGVADVFIDPLALPEKIVILGAGHVGKAIARVLKVLDFPFVMVDHRESSKEYMADVAGIDLRISSYDRFPEVVDIDNRTYIIISTAVHNLDMICLREALKTKAKYIGMLASKSKRAEVYEKLHEAGIYPENDPRVFSPVGIEIKENTPPAIAISIIAQIYQVKTGVIKIGQKEV